MFMSYHTIIYFFIKDFFFKCLYFTEYDIKCCCLSFGWKIDHPLSLYVTRGMEGVIQMFTDAYRWKGVSRFMCTYALSLSLFMFLSSHSKRERVGLSEMVIFSNEINVCCNEISFFTLNCFSETKLVKTVLILIK